MSVVSFVLPTRDRADEVARTLREIGSLPVAWLGEGAEVIVVDNASHTPVCVPARLANGVSVACIRLDQNLAAAARNRGAAEARSPWVVMLDDDSHPLRCDIAGVLASMPGDVAAVGGEIMLPGRKRESGGLPEVIIGCGCAFRRDAFIAAGGYDASFEYYAEEYDLCAKLLAAGHRVVHDFRLRFEHRKVPAGRDFGRIIRRLIRNNVWVAQRYAPRELAAEARDALVVRYRAIARREGVLSAFERGLREAERAMDIQPVGPMSRALWDRFTGVSAARTWLGDRVAGMNAVRIVAPGKGVDAIEGVIDELGVPIRPDARHAVVGTLSPGPMLDALSIAPGALSAWMPEHARGGSVVAAAA